ncbi:predicted protein [Chaetoceros tenuissimus]|uniref:Uncharacterized protein n=1 Tax=Chaetoceros tenuissimus TaxID=426638 RepID=A0AAD3H4M9_9STRA|nr:predicted protein [Chaetoceros tenuissimus]
MTDIATYSSTNHQHGIDTNLLHQHDVLDNKIYFWEILQSHTDRLKQYYNDEETRIKNTLSRLDNGSIENEDALVLLAMVRAQVVCLLEYITHNLELFATSVLTFDEHHNVDTYEEEMTYFQDTYAFIDGDRLHTILKYIDEWSLDIEQGNTQEQKLPFLDESDHVNKRRNSSRSISSRSSRRSSVKSEASGKKNSKGIVRGLTRRISLSKLFVSPKQSSAWRIL